MPLPARDCVLFSRFCSPQRIRSGTEARGGLLRPGVPNIYGLVGGDANAIAPGKRPLSSMAPVIVLCDGKPFLALGARGGGRINTAMLQTILNVDDCGTIVKPGV